jgi:hypothetical protein
MRITIGVNFARAALLCASVALASTAARADRRTLIRAYEFQTQPQGNLEFEMWNDVETPKTAFADSLITHRLELEYGITDRWDVALYHVLTHGGPAGEDRSFKFDSWRAETRYRLAERGVWPVDVMVYLELERPGDFSEPFELEQKLILEKSLGRFALILNLVGEQKLSSSQTGHVWEVDLGARYEVTPHLRVAGEVWGIQEIAPGGTREVALYAGPSISVEVKKFWIQLGAGIGLNDAAQQLQFRSVFGFNL